MKTTKSSYTSKLSMNENLDKTEKVSVLTIIQLILTFGDAKYIQSRRQMLSRSQVNQTFF